MRTVYIVTLETRDETLPDSINAYDVKDALMHSFDDRVLAQSPDVMQLAPGTRATDVVERKRVSQFTVVEAC